MPLSFISIFTNKYVIIGLVLAVIGGSIWLKIHGLERDVEKAKAELNIAHNDNALLQRNNDTLKQNLDMAFKINDANAKMLEQFKVDQDNATESIQKLSTDLSKSKLTIAQAQKRLAENKLPAVPVPQRIVETIVTIQDVRVEQGILNKKAENE